MHRIQSEIIARLAVAESCRYRDIKPAEIEGNQFMYHLNLLKKEGYVSKNSTNRYQLTSLGKSYVDSISMTSLQPRIQPKIATLIACQNDKNEWLMYKRSRQPFRGLVGFPYGKIHLGEKIAEAASRELYEKTGLRTELTHLGDAYLAVNENEQLVSHALFHVFVGQNPRGTLASKTEYGDVFWGKVESKCPEKYIPGFLDILSLINTNQHFFVEIDKNVT